MSTESIIQTHALTKVYGAFTALRDCSLEVRRGEIFGLLGPNGAGKTTLIRHVMGFLKPSSGYATFAGLDCYRDSLKVHARLSYLPGEAHLFPQMRGKEVLRFFANIHPRGNYERSLRFADRLALDLSRMVAFCSTGMKQKLALAAVLAVETELVILDEPTSNLDPTTRFEVLSLLKEARLGGRTIVFSSHVMSEIEAVCDRVCILRAGRLVHEQRVSDVLRQHRIRARLKGPMTSPPSHLADRLEITTNGTHDVTIQTPGELEHLLDWLSRLPLAEVRIEPIGLQAIYDRFHASEAS